MHRGGFRSLYLPASLIAKQVICEYMAYLEARDQSRRAAGLARVVARRVALEKSKGFAARVSVTGEVMGVPVAASPDLAILAPDGRIKYVVKASIRVPPRIHRSDMTYLYVAALLLHGNGSLSSNAMLASVSASSEASLKSVLERAAASGILKPSKSEDYVVYVEVYDRDRAVEALAPLMALWRGERGPRPNPSPGRCSRCAFSDACEYSASRSQG